MGPSSQQVQCLACGNAVEPGGQLTVASELVQAAIRLYQCFLQCVLSVVMTYYDTTYVPVQLFAIFLGQQSEACLALLLVA